MSTPSISFVDFTFNQPSPVFRTPSPEATPDSPPTNKKKPLTVAKNINTALHKALTSLHFARERISSAREQQEECDAILYTLNMRLEAEEEGARKSWKLVLGANAVNVRKLEDIVVPKAEVLKERIAKVEGQWEGLQDEIEGFRSSIVEWEGEIEELQDAMGGDDEYRKILEVFRKK